MDNNMSESKTMMNIYFYEEKLKIPMPSSLVQLKRIISEKFILDMQDVDELVIYYQFYEKFENFENFENFSFPRITVKKLITNEEDFETFIKCNNDKKIDMDFHSFNIFIEVSENSRLYQGETKNHNSFENSDEKFTKINFSNKSEENCNSEILTKEISEKKKLLRELKELHQKQKSEKSKK